MPPFHFSPWNHAPTEGQVISAHVRLILLWRESGTKGLWHFLQTLRWYRGEVWRRAQSGEVLGSKSEWGSVFNIFPSSPDKEAWARAPEEDFCPRPEIKGPRNESTGLEMQTREVGDWPEGSVIERCSPQRLWCCDWALSLVWGGKLYPMKPGKAL